MDIFLQINLQFTLLDPAIYYKYCNLRHLD